MSLVTFRGHNLVETLHLELYYLPELDLLVKSLWHREKLHDRVGQPNSELLLYGVEPLLLRHVEHIIDRKRNRILNKGQFLKSMNDKLCMTLIYVLFILGVWLAEVALLA